MPVDWNRIASAVVMVFFGLSAFAYLRAMGRWRRRLHEVASSLATREQFADYQRGEEHRRLRAAVLRPLLAATALLAALAWLMGGG